MTVRFRKKTSIPENHLEPFCLEQPPKQRQLQISYKGPLILLIVFLFLLIPLIPGMDPTPGFLSTQPHEEPILFPPLEERPLDLISTIDGGFAFVMSASSHSWDYGNVNLIKTDENGYVQWSYQVNIEDDHAALIQTTDGGLALAGAINENITIIKIDIKGQVEWNQTCRFGTQVITLIQATDGGFVLLLRGEQQRIIKLDNIGKIQWQKDCPKGDPDLMDLIQTEDGGYILTGIIKHFEYIPSYSPSCPNSTEIWLSKLSEDGNDMWEKSFQLVQDKCVCGGQIIQTSDSGFAITISAKPDPLYNSNDAISFLIKTDISGDLEWKRSFPGFLTITAPILSSEDTYIVAGTVSTQWGSLYHPYDIIFVTTDIQGTVLSEKAFENIEKSRIGFDISNSLVQTLDQGFALLAYGYIVTPMHYYNIVYYTTYLVKLNATSDIQWTQRYDVEVRGTEWGNALVETSDRGFILAGITFSCETGPDMWLVKTDEDGVKKWNRTYGGSGDEVVNTIIQTKDGDFVLAGSTTSYGSGSSDMWLVKTDSTGLMKWNRTYGTEGKELGYYLEETLDGGFAIMGVSYPNSTAPGEILLVKTDTLGVMQWNKTYEMPEDFSIRDPGDQEFFVVSDQTLDYIYGESTLCRVISFMETTDGGFAFILPNIQENPFQLLKTDENGTVQWNKTLELGIDLGMELHATQHFQSHNRVCIKETSDHGFIIGVTISLKGWYGGMINIGYKGILVKTDIGGVIQWTKKCENLSTIETVFPVDDGIITWMWFDIMGDEGYVSISKIGLDGTWHWNKTCPDEDWTFSVWWAACGVWFAGLPLDTIITSTGEYAIAGITTPPFDCKSIDAWLVKRDTNGTLLWKHTYGTPKCYNVRATIIYSEPGTNSDQRSGGFELIPLTVGVVFLKCFFRRKRK